MEMGEEATIVLLWSRGDFDLLLLKECDYLKIYFFSLNC